MGDDRTENSSSNASLLDRAAHGDDLAWRGLIDAHSGLVWSIVRSYGLGPDGHDDVFQTVWLRLAENLSKITNPERLAAWLARVARNEAVGAYRKRARVVPLEDLGTDTAADLPDPDAAVNLSQTQSTVRAGLARLSAACRLLLAALSASPRLSYSEISDLLSIPVGSIGPTRTRCLDKLRETPEIQSMND